MAKTGRPRKYQDGPGRFTLTLSPADKEIVEDFQRWFCFSQRRNVGIAEMFLEILRRSPEFAAYERAGRADGPLFSKLAQEPAPVTPQAAPVTEAPVVIAPVVQPEPAPAQPSDLETLKVAMKAAGISGRELAQRAGLNPGSLSHVFAGRRPLSPHVLAKLNAALGAGAGKDKQ